MNKVFRFDFLEFSRSRCFMAQKTVERGQNCENSMEKPLYNVIYVQNPVFTVNCGFRLRVIKTGVSSGVITFFN